MRPHRVTASAASSLVALAAASGSLIATGASPAQATETGTNGMILTRSPDVSQGAVEENIDGSGLRTFSLAAQPYGIKANDDWSWSSDGSRLAWSADNGAGLCGIVTSNADLTHAVPLASAGVASPGCWGTNPTWTNDNRTIVYQSPTTSPAGPKDDTVSQLWQEPVAGDEPPTLLFGTDTGYNDKDPRAVGNYILFTRQVRGDSSGMSQLWVYDRTKGTATLVYDGRTFGGDISPDGKTVIFAPLLGGIESSNVDGTDLHYLLDGGFVQEPRWSPSGTKILYQGVDAHSQLLLRIRDVATGDETTLPAGLAPEWQPVNPAAPAPPQTVARPEATVQRIAGDSRYQTGAKVSQQMWSAAADTSAGAHHAQAVVLATGASFPDALAGGPLASVAHGPLLLTEPGSLSPETLAELKRVLPVHAAKPVYVLGGSGAVGNAVADELTALGYSVHRLGGQTRFDTARAIAAEYVKDSPDPVAAGQQAVVATGLNFADALSAGPLASLLGAPILLTNGASLDPGTARYLAGKSLIPVGGPAYTATGLTAHPDSDDFCVGLAGSDRYDTNARVAKCMMLQSSYQQLGGPTIVGVATGANFPDALTGGAWLGQLHAPLLLTEPESLSAPANDLMTSWWRLNLKSVELFGGTGAMAGNVENQIVVSLGAKDLRPL